MFFFGFWERRVRIEGIFFFSGYGLREKPTERAKAEEQRFLTGSREKKGSSRTTKSGLKKHSRYVHCEPCILSF